MKKNNYSEKNIKELTIKESIVNSLSTYTSVESPLAIFLEGLFNATDELLNNDQENKKVIIKRGKGSVDNSHLITIKDNGRGIPIGSLAKATGSMHVTGKSGDQKKEGESAYKKSVGVNGLGSKLISYLSHTATYTVSRDGKVVELKYINGVQGEVEEIGKQEGKETYTQIAFEPINEYFNNSITFKAIANHIKGVYFMFDSIDFEIHNEITGESFFYENTKGLEHYYEDILGEEDELLHKPIVINKKIDNGEVDVSFSYQSAFVSELRSGVNGWLLKDGGTIVEGLKSVLVDAIKEAGDHLNIKVEPIKKEHISSGLTGFAHVFYDEYIKFEGQTKRKVLSRVFLQIMKDIKPLIVNELLKDKARAKKIIDRVNKTYTILTKQDKSLNKIMQEANKKVKRAKGEKLTDITATKNGELYIVEGDSAGGAMIEVRDPKKHAILKLKGKPKNVQDSKMETVFDNTEIQSIICAMGGIGKSFDITKLKYNKIILTADADSDGHHINALLITFFHKFYPELFNEGKIYKSLTPLFAVTNNKIKKYFYTEAEKNAYVKEKKGLIITRFKGLGELDSEQYEEFILGGKQKLQKITNKDIERNEEIVRDLMGKEASIKWHFLQNFEPKNSTEIIKKKTQEISEVIESSLYDYGTYILEQRAIPNAIDGLKTVVRRILWSMKQQGITSKSAKRKVLSIQGGVANYHPHGDSSVGGAITTVTAEWRNHLPLLQGQGNFGNIFSHASSAPRYIEARMSEFAEDVFFANLTKKTTYWDTNYDGRLVEPLEFPAVLPVSLLMNNMGIAFGTKSEVSSYNLGEVVDALIACTKLKRFDAHKYIKAPDFTTGGQIIVNQSDEGGYKYTLRGKIETKTINKKKHLVISEITYGMNIDKFIDKLNEMLMEKDVKKQSKSLRSDVKKITNASGKGKFSILLELKPGVDVDVVKEKIYKNTDLQVNIVCRMNFLKVDENKARQFSKYNLTKTIVDFVAYRKIVLDRFFAEKIDIITEKINQLSAKAIVIKDIDKLMSIIKKSNNETYIDNLIKGFNMTQEQAVIVSKLTTMSLLKAEYAPLLEKIKELINQKDGYQKLIDEDALKVQYMTKEWRTLKKKYNWERRTEIIEADSLKKIDLNNANLKYKEEDYYVIATETSMYKISTRKNINLFVDKLKERGQDVLSVIESSTFENVFVICNTKTGSNALVIKNFQINEDKENIIQGLFKDSIEKVVGVIGSTKNIDYVFVYENNKGFRINSNNLIKERKYKINKNPLRLIKRVDKNESMCISYTTKKGLQKTKNIALEDIKELHNTGVGVMLLKPTEGVFNKISFVLGEEVTRGL